MRKSTYFLQNRGGYQNNQTFPTQRTAIEFIKCPHRARKKAADTYLVLPPSCEHKILHMSGFYAKKLGEEDASPDTLNLAKQQVGPPFYRAE